MKKERTVIYSRIHQDQVYEDVWSLQKHLQQNLIKRKRAGQENLPGYLLICEHAPVYTIGKSGKMDHLKLNQEEISNSEFSFFKINRGGDITYHGPGQLTVYPILDLDQYYNDVHRYVRELEEVIIRVLAEFDIEGQRVDGYTGVWIKDKTGRRKICAIGVHMSRWVSIHGLAFNVNTKISHFDNIIPCGIQEQDTSVTSLERELGTAVDIERVENLVKKYFAEIFDFNFTPNT